MGETVQREQEGRPPDSAEKDRVRCGAFR